MVDVTRAIPAGPAPSGPDRHHNVPVTRQGSAVGARGSWSVLALPLLTTACFAATVALDVATPASGPGVELAPGYGWSYALLGPLLCGLATVILLRDVRQAWGWALAWLGVFWATDGLAQSYVRFGIRPDHALPWENFALWNLNRLGAFLPVTVAVLLMIFPTGRFLSGRWGRACQVGLVLMVAGVVGAVLAPTGSSTPDVALPPGVDLDAFTLPLSRGVADRAVPVAVALSIGGVLLAMASVVVRYTRSRGLERERMRWLLWSVIAMAVIVGLGLLSELRAVQDLVVFLVAALPAVAMTIAIVRPTLVPIEDLVGRTVVYGVLSLVLVAVDLAALAVLTAALGDTLDQRQVVLTVLLLTAVLYGPLRQRLSRVVRRLMLGNRADRYDVVAGLASTLETADEGTGQLAAVARAVASAFGVRFVSVEVDRSGGERLVATYGERPAETRTLPITYRDAPVGRLVLPARGLRSRLSSRDEHLLGDLVRQAATAARSSRMADELQESRERLVVAREEERRRIRRDLHDGLGPALSGVVFRLESARLLVDREPAAAREQLAATTDLVKEVVADVRRLVHDLRPPALDDRGLGRRAGPARGVTDGPRAPRGRRPRAAARGGRGGGVPHRRRGAHQRCPACARHRVPGADRGDGRPARGRGQRRRGRYRRGRAGRRGPALAARAGRRARWPQRGDLSARRRHGRPRRAAPGTNHRHAGDRGDGMSQTIIRVVVVDDHQIVRDGLQALLGALDGVEVVGAAADGRDALHVVDETTPDVVVMDIQMPRLDGIEATRRITARHPGVHVVMLTMNEDDDTVLSAIRAGASGYLLKGSGAEEVLGAIRAAHAGGMVFGATLAARVAGLFAGRPAAVETPFPELTDRERTVLDLLAAGRSNDAIAREIYVSNKTVRNTVSSIYAKLHAAGRAEAIIKAREAGFGRG